ncbi:MAG: tetratricopeptide repeat protein [Verrucomicrobiota bacterium]
MIGSSVLSGEISEARGAFLKGNYDEALELLKSDESSRFYSASHAALELRVLLETGRYPEALMRSLEVEMNYDLELVLAVVDTLRVNGQPRFADELLKVYASSIDAPPDFEDLFKPVAYAELLIAGGVDAKFVLETYLEPAREAFPDQREAYLAIGRLALSKHDRALAAEVYQAGLNRFSNDPEFLLGMHASGLPLPVTLARPDEGMLSYCDLALEANPNYTDALLQRADDYARAKDFEEAASFLERALAVNPVHSGVWARKAALALMNEAPIDAERALREARAFWKDNPAVPEIIGISLAAHYRFEDAISYLSEARLLDPDSASIRFELGSNQLRFGQYEAGWANVAEAHKLDPYNVAAFNLVTLRDKIQDYPILEHDGVQVRMSPEDSAVFGQHALDLAVESKNRLAEKYGVTLDQPMLVELLPSQEDFAIRTFGLPGGESFLGVCFGPLITMTSPRGRLGRANWESVLWHEIAHTITLAATRHRIPRWLTEGISVYEERQVREGWGRGMNGAFRERFLSDDVSVITDLDRGFAGEDVMFAYYHSSLVVEYMMQRFGMESMQAVLADVGAGQPIDTALARSMLPMEALEADFRDFAKEVARAYGPDLDWSPLSDEEYTAYREDPEAWVAAHPNRYESSVMLLTLKLENSEWEAARDLAKRIIAGEPNNRESYNPYWALSKACRGLGDLAGERSALEQLLRLNADASDAATRLLEISNTLVAPTQVSHADLVLETNPFNEQAYRMLASASQETEDTPRAEAAYRSLLALDPVDVSRLHYELADLLQEQNPDVARRQVLKALETNPRFERALELLVKIPPQYE